MKRYKYFNQLAVGIISLFLIACGGNGGGSNDSGDSGNKEYQDRVIIHNLSDAQGLHPHNTSDATATEVKRYLYQKLLEIDHTSLQLIPVLAKDLPVIEEVGDKEGMLITYELRDEATWDDGTPITAADVEFSFKTAKNPK